ncbi:MAG: amidohydrolase family protein [Gemmatimonadota bacterium]
MIRRSVVTLALIATLAGCTAPAPDASTAGTWRLIEGGWLVDVEEGERVSNPGVLISPDGRIARVGDAGTPAPAGVDPEVIELADGQTLLPGLIDLHAHYNMDLTGDGRVEETRYNPLVFLANGVTTTFPGGEYYPEVMKALQDRLESGEQVGPRLLRSGQYFGSTRLDWDPDITGEQIHAEVDALWAEGVRNFKAKSAGPEHIRALVERAHFHGGTVTGHVDSGARGSTNSVDAIEAGIDRIEHILGGYVLDREQAAYPVWNQVDTTSADFRRTVQLFLDNEVYFDPTITAPIYLTDKVEGFDFWVDEPSFFTPYVQEIVAEREPRSGELMSNLYDAMKRTTLAFYNAGGGPWITLGTDNPSAGEYLAGFSAHRELHALVLAGIPPIDALRAGTINGARAVKMEGEIGSIAPGKWADLFVIDGDPLENILNTRNVQLVVRAGEVHDPAVLLEQARGRIGPTGEAERADWWRP